MTSRDVMLVDFVEDSVYEQSFRSLSQLVTKTVSDQRLHSVYGPPVYFGLDPAHEFPSFPFLPESTPLLSGCAQRVQEGVQRRVERQHQDGGHHVDLTGDGRPGLRQQPHDPDGEPAAEVAEDDDEKTAGDGHLLFSPLGLGRGTRLAYRPKDEDLSTPDDKEEDGVEDDENGEGVAVAGEAATGDGKREADASLTVEVPVLGVRQQRDDGEHQSQQPDGSAGQPGAARCHLKAGGQREAQRRHAVSGDEADDQGRHLIVVMKGICTALCRP